MSRKQPKCNPAKSRLCSPTARACVSIKKKCGKAKPARTPGGARKRPNCKQGVSRLCSPTARACVSIKKKCKGDKKSAKKSAKKVPAGSTTQKKKSSYTLNQTRLDAAVKYNKAASKLDNATDARSIKKRRELLGKARFELAKAVPRGSDDVWVRTPDEPYRGMRTERPDATRYTI